MSTRAGEPAGETIGEMICAPGTGWMPGPLAVIRLSGAGTIDLYRLLCEDRAPGEALVRGIGAGYVHFRMNDAGGMLPAAIMLWRGPRSFTGEDCAELVVPGSPVVIDRVISRLCTLGADMGVRLASPGEFSARAFWNGKLTLDQAEGIAAVIGAQSEHELAAAQRLMSGEAGREFGAWVSELSRVLALVEAGIDFTDQEDVVPISANVLREKIALLTASITRTLGPARTQEQNSSLPRVVLVGEPNAGKSTLFNAILGRKRAVESPVAGTTRDVLVEEISVGDGLHARRVHLVDLAGLETRVQCNQIEQRAQELAREELGHGDVLLWCDPQGQFRSFTDELGASSRARIIRVRTKADLGGLLIGSAQADAAAISVCAIDGWNMSIIRAAIADATSSSAAKVERGGVWLVPRHRRVLGAAHGHLGRVIEMMHDEPGPGLHNPELIAGELRAALDRLGELNGQITPDEIIGRVFATFCVGK